MSMNDGYSSFIFALTTTVMVGTFSAPSAMASEFSTFSTREVSSYGRWLRRYQGLLMAVVVPHPRENHPPQVSLLPTTGSTVIWGISRKPILTGA